MNTGFSPITDGFFLLGVCIQSRVLVW